MAGMMNTHEACDKVRSFSPTGNEAADVHSLYDLLSQLGEVQGNSDVRCELISIFERHPDVSLGSPGPIVHSLEESPIDDHVELLAASIKRQATSMTVWMAERCFRSKLSNPNRAKLVESLKKAQQENHAGKIARAIEEALRNYGG